MKKVESFDEIVFENRNKEYGAFFLRKKYSKHGVISLTISMLLILILTGGPLIANYLDKSETTNNVDKGGIMEIFTLPEDEVKPIIPEQPAPPEQKAVEKVKYLAVVAEEDADEDIETTDKKLENTFIGDVDTTTKVYVVEKPNEPVDGTDIQVDIPVYVEEMPVFPGGEAALMKYLSDNIEYPAEAIEIDITGKVYVKFVVTSTGDVDRVQIYRSVDPILDEEAVRVVKTLPKFEPGKQSGVPVSVWYVIPVNFVLNY